MTEPADFSILYPLFAMFALFFGVFLRLGYLRFTAVGSGRMDPTFYRLYQDGEEPEDIRKVTRHFLNLFEVPVLFYVVVLMAYVTHQAGPWMVGCAWAYVACRYVHSAVHLGGNDVLLRFRLFLLSCVVLAVLWGSLLVALVTA